MRRFSMSIILGLFVALAGSASASPRTTTLLGHFTVVPDELSIPGIISVGGAVTINFSWDDAEPNLIASPDYHAINVGTFSTIVLDPVLSSGPVDDVFVSGGTWTSHMRLDFKDFSPGLFAPLTVTITGTGNTPGQILPDFTTILSSLVDIDLTPLAAPPINFPTTGPTQAVITGIDLDGDGLPDSVDNCKNAPNNGNAVCTAAGAPIACCTGAGIGTCPLQTDSGGINTSVPDGIGDACQCGDTNNDGKVTSTDVTVLKRALAGLSPAFSVPGLGVGLGKCNVAATATPGAAGCTATDATVISRALAGLTPGIFQGCDAAQP